MLLGEAEETLPELVAAIRDEPDRAALLAGLAARPGFYVPSIHGARLPAIAAAKDANLPAYSQIRTPHTELRDMFLIEPERGCHRGCTYCVMRRSTNGGMRLVAPASGSSRSSRTTPAGSAWSAPRSPTTRACPRSCATSSTAGARSASPACAPIASTDEIVGLLKRGGYRTLTTAADGASRADARRHPAQDEGAPPAGAPRRSAARTA